MGIYVYQDKVSPMEKKLKSFKFDWKNKSVLELGCNVGKLGLYVNGRGAKKYKGVDYDSNMIKIGIERYGLDLVCMDVSDCKVFEYDVVIAMAVFHHFPDEKFLPLLTNITSKELIFEVPVGINDVGIYQIRTQEWYTEKIEELYGEVLSITDSGATNDPYNKRVIFHCKRNVSTC